MTCRLRPGLHARLPGPFGGGITGDVHHEVLGRDDVRNFCAGRRVGWRATGISTCMNAFIAVVLVCANGLAQDACTDDQALEVRKVRVANELGCATGWQEIIARTERRDEIGKSAYLKTECRRAKEPQ